MPQSIFNLLEERLQTQQNSQLLFKDRTKGGQDYWYVSNFEFKINAANELESIVNYKEFAPSLAIEQIEGFYTRLLSIEKNTNMEIAKKYFHGFLEEKRMSFTDYTKQILNASYSQ